MLRQSTAASVGGAFVFSAMLGSTVAPGDDFLELFEFSAMLGSTVALGDDFVAMVVFSAMLGSTVALGDDFLELFVLYAMLGSTVWELTSWQWSYSAQCLVRHCAMFGSTVDPGSCVRLRRLVLPALCSSSLFSGP